MEFKSIHRYARMSPRKIRYVIDLIRGRSVSEAFEILRVTNKRASYMVNKVLNSALANADESAEVNVESLRIKVARVDEGPTRKWHRPRSRGMWNQILKRTSHITIILSN